MRSSCSMGVASRTHVLKMDIGAIRIGMGIGDFSGSVPRFAYIGSIWRPGRNWNRMFRIWNFAIQIYKLDRGTNA